MAAQTLVAGLTLYVPGTNPSSFSKMTGWVAELAARPAATKLEWAVSEMPKIWSAKEARKGLICDDGIKNHNGEEKEQGEKETSGYRMSGLQSLL